MNHTARAFEYWFASIPGLTDEKKILLRSCMKSGEAIYYIEETELGRMKFLNETDRNTIMQEQKKERSERRMGSGDRQRNLDEPLV